MVIMPMSLSSLLQTYPYKTRACMERVSSVLKLSTNVTVDKMRTQILDYAERNNAEEKIRDLAYQHKQIEAKKMKNASNQPTTSSPATFASNQPPLSQCSSPHPPISPSLFSNFDEGNSEDEQTQIHNDIDELMQMGNDLTQMFEQSVSECDENEQSVQSEQSVSECDENDSTLENSQVPNPVADSARQKCPLVSTVPINDSMWDDNGLNLGNNTTVVQERKIDYMIDESIKIIAAKDTQIENLEENFKTVCEMNARICKENSETRSLISTLIQELIEVKQQSHVMQAEIEVRDKSIHELMCSIKDDLKTIIHKDETAVRCPIPLTSSSSSTFSTNPSNPPPLRAVPLSAATPSFIPSTPFPSSSYAHAATGTGMSAPRANVPNVAAPNETEPNVIMQSVTAPNVTAPNVTAPNVTAPNVVAPNMTEPNPTVLNVTVPNVTVPNESEPNITEPMPNVTAPNVTLPNETETNVTAPTAETSDSTANPAEKRSRRQRIVIIHDSNGEALDAQKLMPGAEVRKKARFNLKQVKNFIPSVYKPEEIDDVVFQVGLNDLRHGATPNEIVENLFEVQIQYKNLFPNARQHVTAIPPLSNEHQKVNKGFQRLCNNLECNFISTKSFLDHSTGRLRANLMHGFHYNDIGIRHLAKEIKKSLFSLSNLQSSQLSRINYMSDINPTQ